MFERNKSSKHDDQNKINQLQSEITSLNIQLNNAKRNESSKQNQSVRNTA